MGMMKMMVMMMRYLAPAGRGKTAAGKDAEAGSRPERVDVFLRCMGERVKRMNELMNGMAFSCGISLPLSIMAYLSPYLILGFAYTSVPP